MMQGVLTAAYTPRWTDPTWNCEDMKNFKALNYWK